MDFDEAVAANSHWKTKLRAYLAKPDKSLNPADVEADNRCPLGHLIHGEGGSRSAEPDFKELRTEHANFHRATAAWCGGARM